LDRVAPSSAPPGERLQEEAKKGNENDAIDSSILPPKEKERERDECFRIKGSG
jgi:hypothetical protein